MTLLAALQALSPAPGSIWALGEASGTAAADSQGHVAGTYQGGYTLGATGLATSDAAHATTFDGATGKMATPDGTYLATGNRPFSWFVVVKIATFSPTSGNFWQLMGNSWFATNNGGAGIQGLNAGQIQVFRARSDTGAGDFMRAYLQTPASQDAWATGTTYDLGFSYDGRTMRLYVDGDMADELVSTLSINAAPSGVGMRVGSSGQGGNCASVTAQYAAVLDNAVWTGDQYRSLHHARVAASDPAARTRWFGAWIPGAPSDYTKIDTFDTDAGRPARVVNVFYDWTTPGASMPDASLEAAVRARGANSMLTWEPWNSATGGASQPTYTLTNITAGNFDAYIGSFADAVKALPTTVFLRLAHEMNGTGWYPWQAGQNGNNAGTDYVAAWQHVHGIFAAHSVANARWVWCPIAAYDSSNPLQALYPGDAYVDYVGMDGYNWGDNLFSGIQHQWQNGYDVFSRTVTILRAITAKPIIVCEVACSESGAPAGRSKAAWITTFFGTELPSLDPDGVVWFDENKEEDWRIESSPAAQTAFQAAVNPAYAGGPPLGLPSLTAIAAARARAVGTFGATAGGRAVAKGTFQATAGARALSSLSGVTTRTATAAAAAVAVGTFRAVAGARAVGAMARTATAGGRAVAKGTFRAVAGARAVASGGPAPVSHLVAYSVRVAWDGTYGGTAYDDITAHTKDVVYTRGRATDLRAVEQGTATLRLKDTDGTYNPLNPTSPLVGLLTPNRPITITGTFLGVTYPLFQGFVTDYDANPDPTAQETTLQCRDLLEGLDHVYPVVATRPASRVDQLIGAILDAAAWTDPTKRSLWPQGDYVDAWSADGAAQSKSALAQIAELLATDLGFFFVDGNGVATYLTRAYQVRAGAPSATLDGSAVRGLHGQSTIGNIVNTQTVTRQGGIAQTYQDAASIATYRTRAGTPITSQWLRDDVQALNLAQYLVRLQKDPRPPAQQVQLTTGRTDAQTAQALACELGQKVHVTEPRMHTDTQATIERVEGHISVGGRLHTVALIVAPQPFTVFTLNLSVLDGPDVLGF